MFSCHSRTGISSNDRARNFQINERLNLRSARLSLGYQHTIWSRNITMILGTLVGEQYVAVKGRKSITFLRICDINFKL